MWISEEKYNNIIRRIESLEHENVYIKRKGVEETKTVTASTNICSYDYLYAYIPIRRAVQLILEYFKFEYDQGTQAYEKLEIPMIKKEE